MKTSMFGRCRLVVVLAAAFAIPLAFGCHGGDDGTVSLVPDLILVKCGEGAQCPSGTICVDGLCVAPSISCSAATDCPAGFVCQSGSCAAAACVGDAQCPAGSHCGGAGFCQPNAGENPPITCSKDADCGAGKVCVNQVCVNPPPPICSKDSDCPAGQACINQACLPVTAGGCKLDTDCPDADVCTGTPTKSCRDACDPEGDGTSVACGVGRTCKAAGHKPTCVAITCAAGEIMVNSVCVIDKCLGKAACPTGESCEQATGSCKCGGAASCAAGMSCISGKCECPAGQNLVGDKCEVAMEDKCAGKTCGGGQVCNPTNGSCECPAGQSFNIWAWECQCPAQDQSYNDDTKSCQCPAGQSVITVGGAFGFTSQFCGTNCGATSCQTHQACNATTGLCENKCPAGEAYEATTGNCLSVMRLRLTPTKYRFEDFGSVSKTAPSGFGWTCEEGSVISALFFNNAFNMHPVGILCRQLRSLDNVYAAKLYGDSGPTAIVAKPDYVLRGFRVQMDNAGEVVAMIQPIGSKKVIHTNGWAFLELLDDTSWAVSDSSVRTLSSTKPTEELKCPADYPTDYAMTQIGGELNAFGALVNLSFTCRKTLAETLTKDIKTGTIGSGYEYGPLTGMTGGPGGWPFSIRCPTDTVAVKSYNRGGNIVDQVGGLDCRRLTTPTTVSSASKEGDSGGQAGSQLDVSAESGYWFDGFSTTTTSYGGFSVVGYLAYHQPGEFRAPVVGKGSTENENKDPIDPSTLSQPPTIACPDRYAMTGIKGRAGTYVDALGIICGEIH